MLDKYKIITITHKRISLKNMGDFVVQTPGEELLSDRLQELKGQFGLDELFYLATCNRILYFFTSNQPLDANFAARFLLAANPHLSNEVLDHIEEVALLLEGMDALNHFYDVAASIDSLVVGERQILGQVRNAYEQCQAWGLTGDSLRLAIQQAVVTAKGIYSRTRIGEKPVSIVSLAIQQMMRSKLPHDARILIVGAGQTNQLVGKFLAKYGFTNVLVFNRTLSKAEQLAMTIGGRASAHQLLELTEYRGGFDCLIVTTAATEPVIVPGLYEQLLQGETQRKLIIDLSIPHNVDEAVYEQYDVQYIEIEGLRLLAKDNLAFREKEVQHAKKLLIEYLAEFPTLYKQRQLELAMRLVPNEIKAVKNKALNEVFRKEVEVLDEATRELVDRMLSYMEKKCIGIPMKAAREALVKAQHNGPAR